MRLRTVFLLSFLGLVAGCTHAPVAMSPATMPLQQGGYRTLKPVTGTDCLWSLFGLLPITPGNTLQRATTEAIEHGGSQADGLVQVTADTFVQHFIVIARVCTQVEGVAIDSRAPGAAPR